MRVLSLSLSALHVSLAISLRKSSAFAQRAARALLGDAILVQGAHDNNPLGKAFRFPPLTLPSESMAVLQRERDATEGVLASSVRWTVRWHYARALVYVLGGSSLKSRRAQLAGAALLAILVGFLAMAIMRLVAHSTTIENAAPGAKMTPPPVVRVPSKWRWALRHRNGGNMD